MTDTIFKGNNSPISLVIRQDSYEYPARKLQAQSTSSKEFYLRNTPFLLPLLQALRSRIVTRFWSVDLGYDILKDRTIEFIPLLGKCEFAYDTFTQFFTYSHNQLMENVCCWETKQYPAQVVSPNLCITSPTFDHGMLTFTICTSVYGHCGVRQNLYVFSLYRNPDLHDRIFDCLLLTSMAAVQAEDVRASFLFVGDLNGHHQEWLGFKTTNRHGIAVFDFATVSGCDQLVVGPTHARGGTLEMMTDFPDLIRVSVVAPIGKSDHSSLYAGISMAQAVPNFWCLRKTFLLTHKFGTAWHPALKEALPRQDWALHSLISTGLSADQMLCQCRFCIAPQTVFQLINLMFMENFPTNTR